MSEEPPERTARARPLRVLIVDDNRDAADSLAMLAHLWGYEVRVVYNGPAGLEAAREFQPDCLLLDIGLPGLDGYALARRLRQEKELAAAKMVAMSAFSSEDHRRRVAEAGFDHCLVKPVAPETVEDMLTMLEQALKLAQRTEALAQQNVTLANQTRELLTEVKEEIREVKEEIREVKEEIREVKEGLEASARPESTVVSNGHGHK